MQHPSAFWVWFEQHCETCLSCRQVGGTRAPREALCRKGLALLDSWEDAELAWAKARKQHTDEEVYMAMKRLQFPGGVVRGV